MASPQFPPITQQNCSNCRYVRTRLLPNGVQPQEQMNCRRSYPKTLVIEGLAYSFWPVVVPTDWCGEWVYAEAGQ